MLLLVHLRHSHLARLLLLHVVELWLLSWEHWVLLLLSHVHHSRVHRRVEAHLVWHLIHSWHVHVVLIEHHSTWLREAHVWVWLEATVHLRRHLLEASWLSHVESSLTLPLVALSLTEACIVLWLEGRVWLVKVHGGKIVRLRRLEEIDLTLGLRSFNDRLFLVNFVLVLFHLVEVEEALGHGVLLLGLETFSGGLFLCLLGSWLSL